MKKHMPIVFAVILVMGGVGWWFSKRMSVPFTGFNGEFNCGDFGIPDKNYNTLHFQMVGDKMIVETLSKSQTYAVGRLDIRTPDQGRLELSHELIHAYGSSINPLAEHFIEGKRNSVTLIGRREGKDLYRYMCSR